MRLISPPAKRVAVIAIGCLIVASCGAAPAPAPGGDVSSPTPGAIAEASAPPVVVVSGSPDPSPLAPGPDAVSVPTSVAGATVVLDAQPGIRIDDARAVTGLPPVPEGSDMPFGAISFALDGVEVGGSTAVTMFLPAGAPEPETYLRFGPEPGNPEPHWYDFSWDLVAGAQRTGGGRLVLHFVDGGRGDDDLTANGRIVDAGGPAEAPGSPPDASLAWNYGVYEPLTVHLTSSSTGSITKTQWLTPEGRVVVGRDLKWSATGGPGGTMRQFVLAVSDGKVWSTREIFIAVPPVMHMECNNRIESDEDRLVAFDGGSNYWPVYHWSTNVGTNSFGYRDEVAVWYEWDPGNGEPRVQGKTAGIHQNDFKLNYQYGQGPSYPTHYTATLYAGAYVPGTMNKVELASCQTEVEFPIPAYDLAGTITIERTGDFQDDSAGQHVVRTEKLKATVTVAMRTDPNDPTSFIDAGSTFKVERVATHERHFEGCTESAIDKSNGTYYYTEKPAPPPGDGESAPPSTEPTQDLGGHSAISGIEQRPLGFIVIVNAEYYPYQTESHDCFDVNLPGFPEVVDSWSCGEKIGLRGLGIEGTIIDLPSGPDRVEIDCTEEGPGLLYSETKITAKGTLTIIGR